MIYFSDFGASAPVSGPSWANVVFLADATNLADGTTAMANLGSAGGTGSLTSDPVVASGKWVFDGNDSYAFSDNAAWTLASPFTVEVFGLEQASIVSGAGIFNHFNGISGWGVFNDAPAGLQGFYVSDLVNGVYYHTPSVGVSYDHAISYDGSFLRYYVNGVYISKTAYTGSMNTTAPLRIGTRHEGQSLDGRIAAIRVSSEALYTSEVTPYQVPTLPLPTS